MLYGKEYGKVSHPMTALTLRVTTPTQEQRDRLKKLISVTWFDCKNAAQEWEATFEADDEERFWDWAEDLEYWMVGRPE